MRNFFINNMKFRIIMSLVCVLSLMLFCVARVADLSLYSIKTVDNISNGYTVEINDGRGNIYDCNGEKITCKKTMYYNIFLPCDEAILKFAQITYGEERKNGLERLRDKKTVIIKKEQKISGVGIYSYKSFERYSNDLGLEHLVGYINAEGNGVTGLEKAYNDILITEINTEIFFETSASGEFLLGADPIIKRSKSKGDVYLTIDKSIQKICNEATKSLKSGAVIVTETATGKIRAMVSKPGFDVYNLKNFVEREDSPLINRALNAYSVGSVFKPLIAAAMLETGRGNFIFNCVGYSDILGIRFYCNNHNGHGSMDLNNAVINSCNTYFYSAGALVKPEVFTELSEILGFGKRIKIADEIYAAKGALTSLEELKKSKANIANFSIGQGNIVLSPLVLCNLYSAIANGGFYFMPQVVEGYTENQKYYKTEKQSKTVVFSKETANILKEYLINAVDSGTGKNAKPDSCGAAGKTATAQTGRYNEEKEILNAWFCGFFPENNPKYIVVILAENASSGSSDCAPVFKRIADNITASMKS